LKAALSASCAILSRASRTLRAAAPVISPECFPRTHPSGANGRRTSNHHSRSRTTPARISSPLLSPFSGSFTRPPLINGSAQPARAPRAYYWAVSAISRADERCWRESHPESRIILALPIPAIPAFPQMRSSSPSLTSSPPPQLQLQLQPPFLPCVPQKRHEGGGRDIRKAGPPSASGGCRRRKHLPPPMYRKETC